MTYAGFRLSVRRRVLGLGLLTFGVAGLHADGARASDHLSGSMFSDESQALWPIEIRVSIKSLASGESTPERTVIASDGHTVVFSEVVPTSRGERAFSVSVAGRHHVDQVVELEYDIEVQEARFEKMGVGDYVLHRLDLSGRPTLGPSGLSLARADIVEVADGEHRDVFRVGDERYEVRISARSLRG